MVMNLCSSVLSEIMGRSSELLILARNSFWEQLLAKLQGRKKQKNICQLYTDWSYDACTRGFLKGCRPFICIDGCHIKTRYKGQLLTAVGVDPNDCIFPIAMGLVEVECTSAWEWFLTTLKDDLNITNTSPFTIMSDKQKVQMCSYFFIFVLDFQ
jgi:hypothetical protein